MKGGLHTLTDAVLKRLAISLALVVAALGPTLLIA